MNNRISLFECNLEITRKTKSWSTFIPVSNCDEFEVHQGTCFCCVSKVYPSLSQVKNLPSKMEEFNPTK